MAGPESKVERAAAEAARRRDAALAGRPAQRRRRGIVHTPPELARFVAVVVDRALDGLGVAGGLADPALSIVDPACGPGAFLAACLAVAGGRGSSPRLLCGVDVDPAAVAQARQVLAEPARRAGWALSLSVANTLEEARAPAAVAPEGPTVVIGNPPWASRSDSRGGAVSERLLEDFRRDAAGRRLPERKLGVLSDDYVRFFRWACEVARTATRGAVVALVTSSSYLDGPVHRGMRAALLRWFDALDVVDLGGSALVARSGARDDNVFGVRPGVAVAVAVRRPGAVETEPAAVRHAAVRGSRRDKLSRLAEAATRPLPMRPLSPSAPFHLLVPGERRRSPAAWPSIVELLPFHREGVQTNRDAVVVDRDRARLLSRLRRFAAGDRGDDLAAALASRRHYDPAVARAAVREALERDARPARLAYRPFDDRWFLPVSPLCHRPRPALLAAVRRSDLVLLTVRKDRGQRAWAHVGVTRHAPDNCWLSTRSSCRTRAFPTHGPDGRPNVDADAVAAWARRLRAPPGPRQTLCYALAWLSCAAYRKALHGELLLDYPRLPPPDPATFERIVAAGERLASAFARPGRRAAEPVSVGHVVIDPGPSRVVRARAEIDRLLTPVFGSFALCH